MNTVIHLANIEFSYTKRAELLSDLHLRIQPGHIHGLLGKNGEGKSTLLKLIAGLLFPRKGSASVLGQEPKRRPPELLRDIYFLAEELPTPALSIADFETVYAPFYPNFSTQQFHDHLRDFDIQTPAWKINKLSFGQKKKVMLAFALAANTRILLMDEPTNGLDIPSKGQFRRMVASHLDPDRCILISTHQVRDLDSLIDNIIILEGHQIILNEPIDNITDKLLFRLKETGEKSEPAPGDPTVLYTEDTLRGTWQLSTNSRSEDSKLDIELLFNAICHNPTSIRQLFHP
jgi:ABC-2 type transport system ATP-binding protein